jgi:hypothetical protein
MEDMTQLSAYRKKLLKELEEMPDDMVPTMYRIIHLLKTGWAPGTKRSGQRGSLQGIWKGSQIDDASFQEARESLFPYEAP